MYRMLARGIGGTMVGLAGGAGALAYVDEGFRRSLQFWGRVFPIYLHYEVTNLRTRGLPEAERDVVFNRLHDRYAPEAKQITLALRGFYLKTAQLCSTIPNTVPPQYMEWCEQMQDEVPTPFAAGMARELVEKSLNQPIEKVFSRWEDEPCGSASIGQVHRATLLDGTDVAVKVQYPGIESKFRSDLENIIRFCKLAMPQHVKPLRELQKQFRTEFDYVGEAKNLQQIHANIMPNWGHRVKVPRPIMKYCTKDILTMEFLKGVTILKGLRQRLEGIAKVTGKTVQELEAEFKEPFESGKLNDIYVEAERIRSAAWKLRVRDYIVNAWRVAYNYTVGWALGAPVSVEWTDPPLNVAEIILLLLKVHAHEVFVDGLFNGDPHPGNVMLMDDGRLGLLDYGQVKALTPENRQMYSKLIVALAEEDKDEVVRLWFDEIENITRDRNPDVAYALASFWHDRNTADVIGDQNMHLFLDDMEKKDPIVDVNDDFVLVARTSILMRGFGNMMGLSLRVAPIWRPYAEAYLSGGAFPMPD